ncbi:hypothetical protein [Segetibacter koreensis]|uniref:hypothetical protein n=1 Tax=Segetibacter koreensis TaxID=398037 RepID=UPI00037375CE|nr:hypothetical protein [Segetibacter koreensis]
MKQNFVKTIQGHQLEFNKQVSRGSYNVSPKNVEFKGVLSLQKDEKGMWNVDESQLLPPWFNEISIYVHCAIEENEHRENNNKENNNSDFLQFAYLF